MSMGRWTESAPDSPDVPTWVRWLLLALLVGLFFPASAPGQPVPDRYRMENLREVDPRPEWIRWWGQAEACVDMDNRGPREVTWYLSDHIDYVAGGDIQPVMGLFWAEPDPHAIYLVRAHADVRWLVKHEAIHAILYANGVGGTDQPRPDTHQPYIRRCAPAPIGWNHDPG